MTWHSLRVYAIRTLIVAALLLLTVYFSDYLSVAFRVPKTRDPFGTVRIQTYYAVRKKNKEIEFMFLEPQDQVCVHSLFPHLGDDPCWYLERHKQRRIDM